MSRLGTCRGVHPMADGSGFMILAAGGRHLGSFVLGHGVSGRERERVRAFLAQFLDRLDPAPRPPLPIVGTVVPRANWFCASCETRYPATVAACAECRP